MADTPDRNATLAEWLAFRGLPAHRTLTDLIEHERTNARLAGTFDGARHQVRTYMDALKFHLKTVHCNEAAFNLTNKEAVEQHHDEHHDPGGLRNHDRPGQLHNWQGFGGVHDPERNAP